MLISGTGDAKSLETAPSAEESVETAVNDEESDSVETVEEFMEPAIDDEESISVETISADDE